MSRIALVLASGLMMSCVGAQTPTEVNLKKLIEPRLGEGVKVDSVKETPYGGLYEVRTAGDILYTDKNAQYLFVGHVFDAKTSQDLTKERLDEMNRIKFSDLPLDSAMKVVKGNGKRVIAVFEDPNCGYCKRFRQTSLKEIDNVTVYTFMYNILSPDSIVKSRNIWCSPERSKAWDDWMLNGKVPASVAATCANPHEKILALGQQLRVSGTPTIFFADGSRIAGAVDTKALEQKFSSIK